MGYQDDEYVQGLHYLAIIELEYNAHSLVSIHLTYLYSNFRQIE